MEANIVITEQECVIFEAIVNGDRLWRVWRAGSGSTREKKRKLLERDIKLYVKNTKQKA